jgi:hypothetical protein|tara:strand:- start:210 stop:416 length:207 start_codon:yes stop_codon:yes gene_type:complete
MSDWVKKLVGMKSCWHCEKLMTKKEIYSVDVDTQDGPINFKMCKACAEDMDEMLKELEETLAERNNTF